MDYVTFYITNIASVTVFAVAMTVLALANRRVAGMRWFALSLTTLLLKLVLQVVEGKLPSAVTTLPANQLYLVSFAFQYLGLHWFVVRRPVKEVRIWMPIGIVLAADAIAFLAHIPYSGNLINVPFVALCFASAWMVWRNGDGHFRLVSRVTGVVLCLQGGVAAYRAILTNIAYSAPTSPVQAHNDPRWVYSLAVAACLATIMVTCMLWFLVTELQWELALQARTDPLTGAMNRRAMEETALRETARAIRYGHALSMIVADIDNFKRLNDTRGHAAGDRALQAMVCRMRAVLRQQDSIARTGGEEFAILLPDTTELASLAVAERLRQAVEELEVPFETGPIKLTICAGVAQLNAGAGWEQMMDAADAAMYEAKKHGRNLIAARLAQAAVSGAFSSQFQLKSSRYVQAALIAM
jgi:diguanylate cyclase (GGDEF)-like protein